MRGMRRDESGASLVEFALILPVFMALLLGMFTGGMAYNRRLTITSATREGGRYGATLPTTAYGTIDLWLADVAGVVESSAEGELATAVASRQICVAFVSSGIVRQRTVVGTAVSFSNAPCFTDGRPANETRVQVSGTRQSKFEALLWSNDLTLTSKSITRYEAS